VRLLSLFKPLKHCQTGERIQKVKKLGETGGNARKKPKKSTQIKQKSTPTSQKNIGFRSRWRSAVLLGNLNTIIV
jgi:hypothetical protein